MKKTTSILELKARLAELNPEKAKVILSKLESENTSAGDCSWKCTGHSKRGHNTALN